MGRHNQPRLPRNSMGQVLLVVALLVAGGFAVAGPTGILAWGENSRLLAERERQVARLEAERDELRNRVNLLDPRHADPDLVGELLRSKLNVAHPDEIVLDRR